MKIHYMYCNSTFPMVIDKKKLKFNETSLIKINVNFFFIFYGHFIQFFCLVKQFKIIDLLMLPIFIIINDEKNNTL